MNDEDFDDSGHDNRGSVDPTSYSREAAERKSRRCQHCSGAGLATVYDFEYDGSPVIHGIDDRGNRSTRPGRICAYCICLLGRWLLENHKKHAKDVYARTPDFADIKGKSSFWLEKDPSQREATPEDIARLPRALREQMERIQQSQWNPEA